MPLQEGILRETCSRTGPVPQRTTPATISLRVLPCETKPKPPPAQDSSLNCWTPPHPKAYRAPPPLPGNFLLSATPSCTCLTKSCPFSPGGSHPGSPGKPVPAHSALSHLQVSGSILRQSDKGRTTAYPAPGVGETEVLLPTLLALMGALATQETGTSSLYCGKTQVTYKSPQ